MTTVTLNRNDARHIDSIRSLLERLAARNPSLNGAQFTCYEDDCTAITEPGGLDVYTAASVFASIRTTLDELNGLAEPDMIDELDGLDD